MTTPKILMLAFLVGLPTHFTGQTVGDPASPLNGGLACVDDMPVPLYDGLAWVVRSSGEFQVSILMGPDAARTLIDVRGKSNLLLEILKSALREARFSPGCVGKRLELTFIYRLDGTPDASPHNAVRLQRGNTFEVVARPPVPIPPQANATSLANGR
jgi:hypothetical protein